MASDREIAEALTVRIVELERELAEERDSARLLRAHIAVYRIYISKLESDLVKARAEQNGGE